MVVTLNNPSPCNPSNKTTKTVVGLRLSNCCEQPTPTTHPPPQTQNYMIEQKQSNTLKTKDISLYEETPKQFLNPTSTPKIALRPQKVKNDPKIESKSNVRVEGNKEKKSQNCVKAKIAFVCNICKCFVCINAIDNFCLYYFK